MFTSGGIQQLVEANFLKSQLSFVLISPDLKVLRASVTSHRHGRNECDTRSRMRKDFEPLVTVSGTMESRQPSPWKRTPPPVKMKPHDSLDVSDHLPAGSFCHPTAVRVSGGYAGPGWYRHKRRESVIMQTPPHPQPSLTRPNSLLASSVSFAARQWHLDHTRSEGDPQGVTLAVYLHADDALVVDAVNAAPEQREVTVQHGFTPDKGKT